MRIATGGLHIESSIFTPYRSGQEDFTIREGQALIDWQDANPSGSEIEWVPLIHGRALPGGIVDRGFFDQWLNWFTDRLQKEMRAPGLDGVFLDIHGAMTVDGLTDAEGLIAQVTRSIVSDRVPIVASMDLHGNVSELLFDNVDLLTCYRTAPHLDVRETKVRAVSEMLALISARIQGKNWYSTRAAIPILLPGERTSTEVEPGRTLYASIPDLIREEGVRDVSLWMGFPWGDEARNHAAVVAFGENRNAVEDAAVQLANAVLGEHQNFDFVGPVSTAAESLEQAFSKDAKRPFFISDTGDNPGAGGTGDSTSLLSELLRDPRCRSHRILFASIFDPKAVGIIRTAKDPSNIEVSLGGNLDGFSRPIKTRVSLISTTGDPFGGETVLLQDRASGVNIIVHEKRNQYRTHGHFERLGTGLTDWDVVIVKMGYLEPDLAEVSADWVMALTPGAVDQDLPRLNYSNRQTPLYPFEPIDSLISVRTRVL